MIEEKPDKFSEIVLFLVDFTVFIFDTSDNSNAIPNLYKT